MHGKMMWFNAARDDGMIVLDDGSRVSVRGESFAGGERPEGRCASRPVQFRVGAGTEGLQAEDVVFLPEEDPRRARLRHGGSSRRLG